MAPLIDGNGEALASAICGDARGVHCDGRLRRIIPNRHIRLVGAALGKRLSGCLGCRNDHAIRGVVSANVTSAVAGGGEATVTVTL